MSAQTPAPGGIVIRDSREFLGPIQVERVGESYLLWFGRLLRVYLSAEDAERLNTELADQLSIADEEAMEADQ